MTALAMRVSLLPGPPEWSRVGHELDEYGSAVLEG